MSYYYISNPYNGSEEEKEERAKVAARICGFLLKRGIHAWSPIVHNHAMMKTFNHFTLEERRNFILDFDFSLLRAACGMIVLELEGWKQSYGVNAEIKLCQQLGIPIKYLNPNFLGHDEDPIRLLKNEPSGI
jgi:hypothetical protein